MTTSHRSAIALALTLLFIPACGSDQQETPTAAQSASVPDPDTSAIAVLGAQGALAVGETRIAEELDTHCGVDPFPTTIDGSHWTATDPTQLSGIDPMPDEWTDTEEQRIDLIIERTGNDTFVATAPGTNTSIEYTRSNELFGCD